MNDEITNENATQSEADQAQAIANAALGVDPQEDLKLPAEVIANLMANAGIQFSAIIKPISYYDLAGRCVVENEVVNGAVPPDFIRFAAQFELPIKVINQDPSSGKRSEGIQRIPLTVPVDDVTTVAEAFAKFDQVAKAAADKYIADLKSQHVRASLAAGITG
jgi:hypothetical protein